MNKLLQVFSLLLVSIFTFGQTIGHIAKETKKFYIAANINKDYKIFGYHDPKTTSQKMICFSVFTSDVEGNPYKCPLGSYYETRDMEEGDRIVFVKLVCSFGKMKYVSVDGITTIFYLKRSSFVFD